MILVLLRRITLKTIYFSHESFATHYPFKTVLPLSRNRALSVVGSVFFSGPGIEVGKEPRRDFAATDITSPLDVRRLVADTG
jgi:hypothetical protein